mmetsp:Transcript_93003/g.179407  ORF Transcript_93003/g.179407 Transcript_93003/m.179407 type:complete len:327 (-) Transcript_93003:181-1161(-)
MGNDLSQNVLAMQCQPDLCCERQQRDRIEWHRSQEGETSSEEEEGRNCQVYFAAGPGPVSATTQPPVPECYRGPPNTCTEPAARAAPRARSPAAAAPAGATAATAAAASAASVASRSGGRCHYTAPPPGSSWQPHLQQQRRQQQQQQRQQHQRGSQFFPPTPHCSDVPPPQALAQQRHRQLQQQQQQQQQIARVSSQNSLPPSQLTSTLTTPTTSFVPVALQDFTSSSLPLSARPTQGFGRLRPLPLAAMSPREEREDTSSYVPGSISDDCENCPPPSARLRPPGQGPEEQRCGLEPLSPSRQSVQNVRLDQPLKFTSLPFVMVDD